MAESERETEMILGFTGHQRIDHPERWDWVRQQLRIVLREHLAADTRVLVALAEGGDQLFAEVALSLGVALDVIVPCSLYEETFKSFDARARYRTLLASSASIQTLDFVNPSEDAFLAAGRYVVDHSRILVTLWNGRPAAGKGGTGDIVAYARSVGRQVVNVDPALMRVIAEGR